MPNGGYHAAGHVVLRAIQQVGQLSNIRRNPPGFVAGEAFGQRTPARLVVEIEVRERPARGVPNDEAGAVVFNRPTVAGSAGRSPRPAFNAFHRQHHA